ncbi:MAG: LLM class flavin-dependent oxidoreductase [Nisaea sp.]|nr:LLM class flavin-dependent oxidoreductase [Nisaea sp.]
MRISVLDQSIAAAGRPQAAAIRDTAAMARHCDRLGYHRFWVSEHHNNPTIVGTAPEILIAAIAVQTQRIRVGSAGVMLPHYAPFKVAEQFRVLDALAPGRIDLGLGRAPGSDGRTAYALNPLANQRPAEFPNDVADLDAWLHGEPLAAEHPFKTLTVQPAGTTAPELWILGSSLYGAQVAAHFGLPYAFAWFFTDGQGGQQALDLYRQKYQPSARHPKPNAAICVWALAADSREEAEFHFASRARWQLFRDRGVFTALEAPETALAHDYNPGEQAQMAAKQARAMIGTGEEVAAKIRVLAAETGVDEVAIVTWCHDEAVRQRSYQLLAAAFDLEGDASAGLAAE